ncbi:MAG: sigma-70 family RNA polymerase sigma factor [Thermoanaerobaculum sp.]|nr:sigma-70 family RNA polymerase sigma factor [Thermoanaerobaculum sp.]MDW7968012.1 sigma-70 family RNA polymerase sigma factor [Thermoanaerobaculum sp.]
MPVDDSVLVEQAQAGDEQAFGELAARYEGKLRLYVWHIVGEEETARDLVQEALLKAWANLHRYDRTFRFSTWLFRIARNLAVDTLRRRRHIDVPLTAVDEEGEVRELPIRDALRSPLEQLANKQLAQALQAEIERLPAGLRELVVLRHFVGLQYQEIAELKKLPLGTVKNKLFRAHSVLREALAPFLGQLGGLE